MQSTLQSRGLTQNDRIRSERARTREAQRGTEDERGQKKQGKETARVETPELVKNKRTSTQEDPSALMRPRTKQTDMFSCFMRTQETKKQNLCMNTHDEYYKIAVMTDAGASETVASAEMSYPIEKTTTSGTTYSSSAEQQAEDTANVSQRYIRVVDDRGTESWAKFEMCKARYWGSVFRVGGT